MANASASEVVRLPVAGMTCDHCVGTVRRALEAIPGVESAAVDLKQGRADVTLDPARADRARLKGAVEAAGYSVPEGGPAAPPPPPNLVTLSPVLLPGPSPSAREGEAPDEPTESERGNVPAPRPSSQAPPAGEEWNL